MLALVLGTAGTTCAQDGTVQYGKENLERDYCSGYNITVYCKAPDNTVVYLYEQDIVKMQVVDSAFLKKGKAVSYIGKRHIGLFAVLDILQLSGYRR